VLCTCALHVRRDRRSATALSPRLGDGGRRTADGAGASGKWPARRTAGECATEGGRGEGAGREGLKSE